MEIQAWSNIEDNSIFDETTAEIKEGSCLIEGNTEAKSPSDIAINRSDKMEV